MNAKDRPVGERASGRTRAKGGPPPRMHGIENEGTAQCDGVEDHPARRVRRDIVQVRPMRPSERACIAAWNLQLIRDEGNDSDLPLAEVDTRLREWLAGDYRASVFEVDGVPFGYSIHRELADCTHLRHFYVEAAYRRRGLGRQAFACLRRDLFPPDRRILVEALVTNDAAIAFWESAGFVQRYVGLQMAPATQTP